MDNFLDRLNRNPYQPIDSASITRVDELGNGYDDWNNLIAPKFEAPQQTWGETALSVATAPARIAAALAGSLSPYGADGWQVPPIVHEGVNALTAVGDAYNYGMSEDEINNRALGMAGFMMGGGGLAARPAGGTGMFAGRLAKTADQEALARAERLAAEGADRNAIWNETGWFQGPDQKWRFEIDDSAASFSPPGSTFAEIYDNASGFKSMGDVLSHQNLYGAYPDTADLGLGISKGDVYGSFGGRGVNDLEIKGSSPRGEAMETLLHEGQHAIQATEEFAKGGNPESMSAPLNSRASWEARLPAVIRSELDDLGIDKLFYSDARVPEIKESIRQRIENDIGQPFDFRKIPGMDGLDEFGMALEQTRSFPAETLNQIAMNRLRDTGLRDYERLAGETEARNVQKRMNMSADERRATPPWETQDIPDIDQIVRLYSNASKEGAAPALISATQTGIGLPAFEMRAPGGKSIGRAQYDELPNAVRVKDVEIDPAFRRQGMASRLYGEIQDRTGKPMTPDTMLTPDGKAFWESSYPKAVSDYEFDGQYWRQPYTPDESVPDWRMSGGPNRPEGALWSNASKESSIPAIASALDMSPEARLARARDLGFDTENVVYHGTDKQFDSFMPSRGGSAGPGVYVTPNAKHARHFGDVKELMLRGKYATWADVPEAVTIRPWYRDFLGLDGGSPAIRAAEWARNNGYDGFKQEGYQTVVFDPRNIRSVNAAFDPAMSDSANLLAANADSRPALLASALGQDDIPDWLLPYLPPQ